PHLRERGPDRRRGAARASRVTTGRVVADDSPVRLGLHKPNDMLRLNVEPELRDPAGAPAQLAASSTPGSLQYGRYLTGSSTWPGTRRRVRRSRPPPGGSGTRTGAATLQPQIDVLVQSATI